eukprot:1151391-Pelagomonas_calceolata.AAC.6
MNTDQQSPSPLYKCSVTHSPLAGAAVMHQCHSCSSMWSGRSRRPPWRVYVRVHVYVLPVQPPLTTPGA